MQKEKTKRIIRIRRVESIEEFNQYAEKLGELYQTIFNDPPYNEVFTDAEAQDALCSILQELP